MSLVDDINAEAAQYGGGSSGDFFKFEKKGVYKMRLLNRPKVLATHFFGKGVPAIICIGKDKGCTHHKEDDKRPSIKLVTYIIRRWNDEEKAAGKKEQVQLAELPLSLSYSIDDLQKDEDFRFEDYPIPFDIKVTYDPENPDPKAIYRLQPSPQKTNLTSEEQKSFDEHMKKMTPEQYVEKRKAKQMSKGNITEAKVEFPTDNDIGEEIPF